MKLSRITIYILLVYLFFINAAQPVHAEVLFLATQSGTPGTVTQSPTRVSSTQSQTSTPSATPTVTPTTTLIPLPEITLIFPVSTPTPTVTITPTPALPVETPNPVEAGRLKNLSPRFKLLAVLISALWLILMGFVILYVKQFK
jgi:hypothetical protein